MATNIESLKEVLREAAKTAKEQEKFARYDDIVRFFEVLTKVTKEIEPTLSTKLSKELSETLKSEVQSKFGGAFSSVSEADRRFKALLADLERRQERISQLVREAKESRDNDSKKVAAKFEKEVSKLVASFRKAMDKIHDEMLDHPSIDDVMGFFDRALENIDPADVRDKLELLEGEERLDKSAIKGLDEELNAIREIKTTSKPGGGITGKDMIQSYDLSPYLDGVTKTFAIPGNWRVLEVSGTSFPFRFRRLVDYTYTPQEITFTDQIDAAGSLAEGQTVEILYVIG